MLRLLGWAYVPFIEMGAGFAGGAADLLCVRAVVRVVVLCCMGTCTTPILVFLYGVYICRVDMLCWHAVSICRAVYRIPYTMNILVGCTELLHACYP